MELQLTLSLPSSSISSSSSCFSQFDLNNFSHESVEANVMFECMKMEDLTKRKLCVHGDDDAFRAPKTRPFLFCNKQDEDCDGDGDGDGDGFSDVGSMFIFMNHNIGGEDNGVVGWPPVKSSRKKLRGGGGSKSMYVKVHMEGVGIARKIDLNLHSSYHTLVHTLAHMFGKCNGDVQLTYQDKEGDWLLAGDVPWGSFVDNVRRLKLLKCNG